jgi:peptidoglycan/LPS O-acetylase OafA/YrhL
MAGKTVTGINRSRTLDGIRGILAVLVVIHHSLQAAIGSAILLRPATAAVIAFFMLSGCVLTRAWDGHYGRFLLGRVARLWPVYALCLAAGYLFSGTPPSLAQFAWCAGAMDRPLADVPAWSLVVEAWAMPFMPLFVWVACRPLRWLIAALAATLLCATYLNLLAFWGVFFFAGAWLSRFSFDWPLLEMRLPQWLGRISYPLYLCHWPILFFSACDLHRRAADLCGRRVADGDHREMEHPGLAGGPLPTLPAGCGRGRAAVRLRQRRTGPPKNDNAAVTAVIYTGTLVQWLRRPWPASIATARWTESAASWRFWC